MWRNDNRTRVISMAELVKIPLASVNYQGRFDRPYIGFIGHDRARVFEAVLTALLPFKIRLADTEFVTTGTPAEHKAIFKLPERGIRFEFGAEEYRFNKELASWATMDEDRQVLLAAEHALMEGSDAKITSCTVIVAMHLGLLNRPREEILAPFIPEPFKAFIAQRQAQTYGNHLKFAD